MAAVGIGINTRALTREQSALALALAANTSGIEGTGSVTGSAMVAVGLKINAGARVAFEEGGAGELVVCTSTTSCNARLLGATGETTRSAIVAICKDINALEVARDLSSGAVTTPVDTGDSGGAVRFAMPTMVAVSLEVDAGGLAAFVTKLASGLFTASSDTILCGGACVITSAAVFGMIGDRDTATATEVLSGGADATPFFTGLVGRTEKVAATAMAWIILGIDTRAIAEVTRDAGAITAKLSCSTSVVTASTMVAIVACIDTLTAASIGQLSRTDEDAVSLEATL
jgi:hypothetical protein